MRICGSILTLHTKHIKLEIRRNCCATSARLSAQLSVQLAHHAHGRSVQAIHDITVPRLNEIPMLILAIRGIENTASHARIWTDGRDLRCPAIAEILTLAHQQGRNDVVHAVRPLLLGADVDAAELVTDFKVTLSHVGARDPLGAGIGGRNVPVEHLHGVFSEAALAEPAQLLAAQVLGWDQDVLSAEGAGGVGA